MRGIRGFGGKAMMVRSVMMRAVLMAAGSVALASAASAQVRTVDPNSAIDADLAPAPPRTSSDVYYQDTPPPAESSTSADADLVSPDAPQPDPYQQPDPVQQAPSTPAPAPAPTAPAAAGSQEALRAQAGETTYKRDDLISAAEGVFGRGAEGLAGIIENILRDQGEPSAYISGREAGGAFIVGLRYGSGTLFHKVEGQRPVYWTGPSVGFDVGGNASKTFVLVYNLYDSQELYRRFPAGEGTAYLVGGFNASYLRWGDVVLIPIRLGVGWRLGVNAGYMRFTERQNWVPF
ncbi:DUF1134 domain-containing protein [Sphingomonas jejuensis]